MLHMRKLRCTSKEWMNTSMRHHALLQTGFHGPPNWQNSSQGDVRVSIAIETCGDSARLSGNYVIAMKWWLSAADKGNASAQMKAAYLYEEGSGGTPVDYTQPYKWYDIAAAVVGAKIDRLPVAASHNGEKDNSDQLWHRDQVAKRMTSEQIAEAQRLAREWKPEHNSTASLP